MLPGCLRLFSPDDNDTEREKFRQASGQKNLKKYATRGYTLYAQFQPGKLQNLYFLKTKQLELALMWSKFQNINFIWKDHWNKNTGDYRIHSRASLQVTKQRPLINSSGGKKYWDIDWFDYANIDFFLIFASHLKWNVEKHRRRRWRNPPFPIHLPKC